MRLLIRLLATAAALAVATAVVPGIELQAASVTSKVLTLIAVALIFGVVNAILKPILNIVGCAFYVLTLAGLRASCPCPGTSPDSGPRSGARSSWASWGGCSAS